MALRLFKTTHKKQITPQREDTFNQHINANDVEFEIENTPQSIKKDTRQPKYQSDIIHHHHILKLIK